MSDLSIPEENYAPVWANDTRQDPPRTAGELETLIAFLDWHRQTLALKCAGVSPEDLARKTVPPSGLSLHGIVRHLAGAERWWFRLQFAGEDVPMLYYSDDDPAQDFESSGAEFEQDLAVWQAECERSRRIVSEASSLEVTGTSSRGRTFTLRWMLVNMIAEYARHNGQADLLRERIDGAVGT